jgi:hypothetical protein
MPPRKKPFKEKFQLVDNEWRPKPGGGWQTQKDLQLPPDAQPWLTNLRMWISEMNQWAEVVNDELHELRDEVESLKRSNPPTPAVQPEPSPR